jgi:hypothetical protein
MNDHTGCERGFTHYSEAYYAKLLPKRDDSVDEVIVGFYAPEGGTSGEFAVEWVRLSGKATPRLRVFDDAWHALAQMPDLLARMSDLDSQDVSPKAFCALLLELGFKDQTQRERPASAGPDVQALRAQRESLKAQLDSLDQQIAVLSSR